MTVFAHGGVLIHAEDPCMRKAELQRLLHLLRADAGVPHQAAAAMGAGLRHLGAVAAVVAHQPAVGGVEFQTDGAMGTFQRLVTAHAGRRGGIAPPVHKENTLLPAVEVLHQLLTQLLAQCLSSHCPLPQIQNGDVGQRCTAIAVGQLGKQVFPFFGTVRRFDAGGGGG